MAAQQIERHKLGRKGEKIVAELFNGKTTNHTAPFDVVDFTSGKAYEVKSMSALSKDLKIHISDHSYERKVKFAKQYKVKMVLIAVVIYNEEKVEVYSGKLKQSVRINQMKRINLKARNKIIIVVEKD
jgi:hypothetical protein